MQKKSSEGKIIFMTGDEFCRDLLEIVCERIFDLERLVTDYSKSGLNYKMEEAKDLLALNLRIQNTLKRYGFRVK